MLHVVRLHNVSKITGKQNVGCGGWRVEPKQWSMLQEQAKAKPRVNGATKLFMFVYA